MGITLVQVKIYEKLKNCEIINISQDGNKKLMILLAAIYAVAFTITLVLIYQRELGNLRNLWIDNISQNIIYFPVISTN